MQKDGPQSNAAKEIKKSEAENMIREYLERAGVIVDTDIPDTPRQYAYKSKGKRTIRTFIVF